MFQRIKSLVTKEFIHLINDWWLPAFMLFGGATELLLVGWATSRPITNLPIMVWDQDHSSNSRQLVTALENTGTFAQAIYVQNMETIEEAMDRGEINAALIVPSNFSQEIKDPSGSPLLPVILNGAESIPATAAMRAIEGVTRNIGEQIILDRLQINPEEFQGFIPSLRVWFNESLSEALYTTPAELGLMLEFTVLLFASLSFSRERELGTLEQLLVMPFSSIEIIIGKAIPVILVGFFDFVLMLGMVNIVFGVPIRGSFTLVLLISLGYILVELSKGLVISVLSRSQHQAFLMVMLIGMGDFMFTGYAAPVEGMPKIVQLFANIIPAHHFLEILRGILLKGSGMDVIWPHALALILLGTIITTFSLRFVRKALD
jgi:ABC-2 type transport system permease protein